MDTLLPCGHWAPRCSLHTLRVKERVPDKPWDSESSWPAWRRHHHRPDITAQSPTQTWCWGAQAGRAGALAPTPARGPRVPRPGPDRSEDLRVSQWCALPGAAAHPEHPPRRKSSLRASSASSRSPPADARPEPSSPRASMGPAAAALRPRTLPGPRESTASVAPGRRPSDSGRCWALRPRAALGPGASDRAEGGAGGGRGRGAGRGPGVAETFQGRPPALRALAGTGRGGTGPGLPAGAGQGPAAPCLRVPSAG